MLTPADVTEVNKVLRACGTYNLTDLEYKNKSDGFNYVSECSYYSLAQELVVSRGESQMVRNKLRLDSALKNCSVTMIDKGIDFFVIGSAGGRKNA